MKNPRTSGLFAFLMIFALFESALSREFGVVTMKTLSGLREYGGFQNYAEIESLGLFAVQEHNRRANSLIQFGRVLKFQEQVVAGKLYHLTLEAFDAGMTKLYEAKVWVKPWMNFKRLEDFKSSTFSPDSIHNIGIMPGR